MFSLIRKELRPVRSLFDEFRNADFSPAQMFERTGDLIADPAVDVEEKTNEFVIRADLPGLKKDEISIEARGECLVISGVRKLDRKETGEGGRDYHERFEGSFSRTVRLPEGIESEGIQASYRDGVLEVKVPKAEDVKIKKITIN